MAKSKQLADKYIYNYPVCMCIKGNAIGLSVIGTKIATSGNLGIRVTYKLADSFGVCKKLSLIFLESLA